MSWHRVSESIRGERSGRASLQQRILKFGIPFLDDATGGILPTDLILLGAMSGIGKTEICCKIANANSQDAKRVRMFALESERLEIERRTKFQLVAGRFFSDPNRPSIGIRMSYRNWVLGEFGTKLEEYESWADDFIATAYDNFFVFYKEEEFTTGTMVEQITRHAQNTDLILFDHAHFLDFEDDNENRALKQLAKTARALALEEETPIILVAHLRKRSKDLTEELVPDMEEFHGSSDLFKVATKVVTMAPGRRSENGSFETYFRVPKCRIDGGVKMYIGRTFFSPKTGEYENGYKIGWASCTRKRGFEEIDRTLYPDWAREPQIAVSGRVPDAQGQLLPLGIERRPYVD